LIFIVIIAIFGTVRSYKFKFFGDQEFTVFIVQPNIDQYKKWDADFRTEILDELKQYALAISKDKTDLVLWPETVLTGLVPMDRVSYSAAKDITNTAGGLNILGSPYNDEDDKEYNAVLMFENGEDHKAVHKKNCLVPFGEYFPYRSFFAWFCTAINKLGDFSRGTDAQVFDDGRICVGSMICSENFYPVMSRRFVLGGARVISSHTNDAWFYNTAALPQHFAMNVLRAVENRKAVLVAANSGISGIIESSGVIVSRTQTDQRALLRGTFFQNDFKTFYVKFKDLFAYICIGLILSVFIYSILLCKRGKTCLNNRKKEYMR
jgi:apolipoprotein N-acyltransferase